MNALAMARTTLARLLRDRRALFFSLLLPFAIILIVGVTVGGTAKPRVGVVGGGSGPIAGTLAADLRGNTTLAASSYGDLPSAKAAARREELDAVVAIPTTLDADVAAGRPVSVTVYIEQAGQYGQAAASAVSAAVADHAATVEAARFAVITNGGALTDRLATATDISGGTPVVSVKAETLNSNDSILPAGYSYSTPTMLVLFVFINAIAYSGLMIRTRQLGIYSRALAAPVRPVQIVLGETLAYLAIALLQSGVIVGVGSLFFGVRWGDPLAATVLVTLWALLGTGAGVLAATLFRTQEQASAMGPTLGIALGMLGGCMWPLALVTPVMRTLGHLAPQAWAVDAWTILISRNGGVLDIGKQLGILAAFAVGLLALATYRLRRRLLA